MQTLSGVTRAGVACRASQGFGKAAPAKPKGQAAKPKQNRGEKFKIPDKLRPKAAVLRDQISDKLGNVSVMFLGDSTELNAAAAAKFATASGYAPISVSTIIEEYTGKPVKELEESEGRDSVTIAELSTLEQLGTMVRCSSGLLGGGWGASARGDAWRHMYGAFTVWVDTKPEETEEEAPQRGAYSQAEVHVKLAMPEGGAEVSMDDMSEAVVAQALPALYDVVDKNPKFTSGKPLYIKLGCRGDWPEIMPPDWNPEADAKADAATAET